MEKQDKIERYLRKEMTAMECQQFEKELAADDQLREQLELTRNIQQAFISRGEKLAKMRSWERKEQVAKKPAKSLYYWISGIAAVFIIGFFLSTEVLKSSSSDSRGLWEKTEKTAPRKLTKKASPRKRDSHFPLEQRLTDDYLWIKAHLLIWSGQGTKALVILDELRNREGEYREEADDLYEEIISME